MNYQYAIEQWQIAIEKGELPRWVDDKAEIKAVLAEIYQLDWPEVVDLIKTDRFTESTAVRVDVNGSDEIENIDYVIIGGDNDFIRVYPDGTIEILASNSDVSIEFLSNTNWTRFKVETFRTNPKNVYTY